MRPKGPVTKLMSCQSKCLRIVAGAYKATPIEQLETETFIPPIDLYLDGRVEAYQKRIAGSLVEAQIQKACSWIRRRTKSRKATPSRAEWTTNRERGLGMEGEKAVEEAWSRRWESGVRSTQWRSVIGPPSAAILDLYRDLLRAESSMLVQIRTERTGLAYFLNIANVPGFESGECRCGGGPETARHVIIDCELEDQRRERLWRSIGEKTFEELTSDPGLSKVVSKWFLQSQRLLQFKLATSLLYGEEDEEETEWNGGVVGRGEFRSGDE
jgi:hypothetical protein